MTTATIKYDFDCPELPWIAVADWNPDLTGIGETPEGAVNSLAAQCSKHNLWPK